MPTVPAPFRKPLRIEAVADALNCSRQHVIDLIDEGQLRAINLAIAKSPRRAYRIPVEAFEDYLRRQTL